MAGWGRWLAVGGTVMLVAALVPWRRPRGTWAVVAGAAALALATALLGVALVRLDPTIAYVADHARRDVAWWWRLSGLWGGTEGSLLLFAALVAGWAALALWRDERRVAAGAAPTLAPWSVALVAAPVALVSTLVAGPFATLAVPAVEGTGLVPILEHWAMLVHPPLTYLGLAWLVVPGGRAVTALWRGAPGPDLVPVLRRDLHVAWALLAAGMLLGSRWAYVELGWGGWWAWDAVENTSLLPWLAVTAALHLLVRTGRDGRGERGDPAGPAPGVLGVVLGALVLALAGTTLTRSGAASSVHAFAEAVDVGWGLGALTVVAAAGGVVLVARAGRTGRGTRGAARAGWLEAAAGLQLLLCALIGVGTLAPLVRRAAGEGPSATDPSFFTRWTAPLAWLLLGLLVAEALRRRSRVAVALAVAGGLAGLAAASSAGAVRAGLVTAVLAGAAAGGSVGASVGGRSGGGGTARLVSPLAHLGAALLLLGAAAGTGATTTVVPVAAGEEAVLDGLVVRNEGARVEPTSPEDRPVVVVPVVVEAHGRSARLEPSVVGYPRRGIRLAETATWSTWRGDVQVAVQRAADDGRAVLVVHRRPLVGLVWLGGGLLVAAGVLAVSLGAPGVAGRRRAAQEGGPVGGRPGSRPARLRSSR